MKGERALPPAWKGMQLRKSRPVEERPRRFAYPDIFFFEEHDYFLLREMPG